MSRLPEGKILSPREKLANFGGAGRPNDGTRLGERVDFPGAAHLPEEVAKSGGFDRARNHGTLTGICGELVQEIIAASSSDDVNGVDGVTGNRLDPIKDLSVPESEALEYTPHQLALG
jgi:hypothetical protein